MLRRFAEARACQMVELPKLLRKLGMISQGERDVRARSGVLDSDTRAPWKPRSETRRKQSRSDVRSSGIGEIFRSGEPTSLIPSPTQGNRHDELFARIRTRTPVHPGRSQLARPRIPGGRRRPRVLRACPKERYCSTSTRVATSTTSAPGDRRSSAMPIPGVVEAVREAAGRGLSFGAPTVAGDGDGRARVRPRARRWTRCAW